MDKIQQNQRKKKQARGRAQGSQRTERQIPRTVQIREGEKIQAIRTKAGSRRGTQQTTGQA
jgi:hypothetical protein